MLVEKTDKKVPQGRDLNFAYVEMGDEFGEHTVKGIAWKEGGKYYFKGQAEDVVFQVDSSIISFAFYFKVKEPKFI